MMVRYAVAIKERLREARKNSRVRAVVDGTVTAAFAKVLTILVSLVSLPLCVHYFGPERYGVWITIVSTSAWLAVLEFGITDTITNLVSASYAADDQEAAARQTTNALAVTLIFAISLFGLGSLLWSHLDWMRILNVHDQSATREIRETIGIACSLVLLTPLCTIGLKILSGYRETHVANLVTASGAIISGIALICGIKLHLTMPWIYFLSSGVVTFSGLATLLWTVFVSKPWLRPRLYHLNPRIGRALLAAGFPFFAIRIASVVVFSTDNVIVSHYLGASQVTPYSVAMRLATYAQIIPSFIYPSLWAAYAEAHARGEITWIRRAYRRTMRSSVAIMCAFLLILACFGRWLVREWVGIDSVPSEALLILMCVWTLVSGATGVQSCLLGAVQRNRLQAAASIAAALLNLPLSMYLVQRVGSIGAVEGTLISYLFIVGPQSWAIRKYFSENEVVAAI